MGEIMAREEKTVCAFGMEGNWRRLSDGVIYRIHFLPNQYVWSDRGMFGSLVFPGLKEYIFTSLKKMKTFHLYNAAGAHYNTIEPCQSNFVRVNRPGGSMRSGLYKHLKLDQS